MKVVMIQNVKNVGQKDSVVEVSDGFALNSLIPQGKAIQATQYRVAELEKKRIAKKTADEVNSKKMDLAIQQLDGSILNYQVKANDKGSLFKKVTLQDISTAVSKHYGIDLPHSAIHSVDLPISRLGEYSIQLSGTKTIAKLTLNVIV